MRVLINVRNNPSQGYVVHLHTEPLIEKIRGLISRKKHQEAITTALREGILEKEVGEGEINSMQIGLMLSENSAKWDLTAT